MTTTRALTVVAQPSRFELHQQQAAERARLELAVLVAKEAGEHVNAAASMMATASVPGKDRISLREQYLGRLKAAADLLNEIQRELGA